MQAPVIWYISYILLWLLVLLLAIVLIGVLKNLDAVYSIVQSGTSVMNKEFAPQSNLKAGENLPDIEVQLLSGEQLLLRSMISERSAIIVVNPGCEPCHERLVAITQQNDPVDPLSDEITRLIVLSIGELEDTNKSIKNLVRPDTIVAVAKPNLVARKWGLTVTPTTVIVDSNSRVVRQIYAK